MKNVLKNLLNIVKKHKKYAILVIIILFMIYNANSIKTSLKILYYKHIITKQEKQVLEDEKKLQEILFELQYKTFMKECLKNQIIRILEEKEVVDWYCESETIKYLKNKD